jgi:hypothetical protein
LKFSFPEDQGMWSFQSMLSTFLFFNSTFAENFATCDSSTVWGNGKCWR